MSGKYVFPAGLLLFVISLALYFHFSDRGRKDLLISSLEPVSSQGVCLEELAFTEPDFEKQSTQPLSGDIVPGDAHSGTYAYRGNGHNEYSYGISGQWSEYDFAYRIREIRFTCWIKASEMLRDMVAVCSIDSAEGPSVLWQSAPVKNNPGKWTRVSAVFRIPLRCLNPDYRYRLYIWNRSGQSYLLDDLSAGFYGFPEYGMGAVSRNIIRNEFLNYEHVADSSHVVTGNAHSGSHSIRLSGDFAYGPGVTHRVSEVSAAPLNLITLGVWIYPEEERLDAVLVTIIRHPDGSEYVWEGRSTDKGIFPKGTWTRHRAQYKLPVARISPADEITAYVWNKGGTKLLIDDFDVVFGEQQARVGGDPALDMSAAAPEGVEFRRNRPPFATTVFVPVPGTSFAQNPDPDLTGDAIRWTPGDLFSTGHFVKGNGLTQVVRLHDGVAELFGYCTSRNRFRRMSSLDLPLNQGAVICTTWDMNRDGIDEVFVTGHNGEGCLLQVRPGINPCADGPGLLTARPVPLPSAGDFLPVVITNSNSHNRLLLFDKNNNACYLLEEVNGNFSWRNSSWADESPERSLVSALWNDGFGLQCIFADSARRLTRTYAWNDEQLHFTSASLVPTPPVSLFRESTVVNSMGTGESGSGSGSSSGSGSGSGRYIIINRDPKFEILFMGTDNNGYVIESVADFRETLPAWNPKFYECVCVLPGSFTVAGSQQLLTVMAQCNDSSFACGSCNSFGSSGGIMVFVRK